MTDSMPSSLPASLQADAERLLLAPAGLDLDKVSRSWPRSTRTTSISPISISSIRRSRAGAWRKASSRQGRSRSTAAWVCARSPATSRRSHIRTTSRSDALDEAAVAVRAIGRQGQSASAPLGRRGEAHALYGGADPVASLPDADKVALLMRLERKARARDPRVAQVMASLAGEHETMLIARSDGLVAADVRPLVRVSLTVIVEEEGRREQGYAGGGGRFDYAHFDDARLDDYAKRAVDQALLNLSAREAPAGNMTVVLGHGWPGILLHEAIGHGLEGDFNRKGTSAFAGRVGERVAAPGRHRRRRRHARRAARLAQPRRRRQSDAAHGADRGRRPAGLHAGSPERGADGRRRHRQRPARIVRAPADAADDQHDHARRRARSRGNHRVGPSTVCTRPISAAARSTSPAASSCSPRRRRG